MANVVLLIHGILHGLGTKRGILALEPYLRRYEMEPVPYNWGFGFLLRPLLWTGRYADEVVELARKYAVEGNTVLAAAHSHGANILGHACRKGAPIRAAVLFNAAADRDTDFAHTIVVNFYTPTDSVLPLTWLWPVPGDGQLGRRDWGPRQRQKRRLRRSVDMYSMFGVTGHSDVFENEDALRWAALELDFFSRPVVE